MPMLDLKERIPCDIQTVWSVTADIASYPHFMPSVRKVEIIEDELPKKTISQWSVMLNESVMQWQECDMYSAQNFRIDFHQTEGDLKAFSGYWQLRMMSEGQTEVQLFLEFDIGIPALEEIIHPIAIEALANNAKSMLQGIANQVTEKMQAIA